MPQLRKQPERYALFFVEIYQALLTNNNAIDNIYK